MQQKIDLPANMNWLIYTLYARQEYEFCKDIIEQQLKENFDQEFLYFIKVRKRGLAMSLTEEFCFFFV